MLKIELDELKESDLNIEKLGLDTLDEVSDVQWSEDEQGEGLDSYQEPEHEMLECPQCHHVDRKIHFKKV